MPDSNPSEAEKHKLLTECEARIQRMIQRIEQILREGLFGNAGTLKDIKNETQKFVT